MRYFAYNEHDDVISPEEILSDSIIIFDDISCSNQDNVKLFFSMSRHKNVDCFYLNQSYARIQKHLVRENSNVIVLFKQDDMNLRHVYDDHVNTGMTFERFKELCSSWWGTTSDEGKNYGFLVIDKYSSMKDGRYRKTFDTFDDLN